MRSAIAIPFVLCLLFSTGCEGRHAPKRVVYKPTKSATPESKLPKATPPSVQPPEGNPAARLIGTWEAKLTPATSQPQSEEEQALLSLADFRVTLEIAVGGRFVNRTSGRDFGSGKVKTIATSGQWKLVRSAGSQFVLDLVTDAGIEKQHITLLDDNHFDMKSLELSGAEPLRYQRVLTDAESPK